MRQSQRSPLEGAATSLDAYESDPASARAVAGTAIVFRSLPSDPLVEIRREGPACMLLLQRDEKLNALSTAVERELLAALETEEVRGCACVVFAGAGRAFSAGADITELRGNDPDAIAEYYRDTGDVYERIAALAQPTVSAIHGYCLGGGLELALATDFRIADETAVFGFPEISLGIFASSGGTHRLVRLVGPARAKELLLIRPRFGAQDALDLGVVTQVVPEGKAVERALQIASEVAELPQLAVSVTKQAVDRLPESSREAGILIERLAYGMLAQTKDAEDAAAAFVEKRSS
jgi:enoyl-CoA hydratase/carnithine racemase